MTFDDDFVRVHTEAGVRNWRLKGLGLEWPPPAVIDIFGFKYERDGISEITDQDRAAMTFVCRGAEYFPCTAPDAGAQP